MENNELKKVSIKNRMCYYFRNMIKIEDFNFGNILLNEKSYESILICNVSFKTLIGTKSLRIMFDKVDGFIGDYDGTRYLILFRLDKYNVIYDRIIYVIGLKSDIAYVFLRIMQTSKLIQMVICF